MLDGRLLIDAHVHPPRLPTLKAAWMSWAEQFGQPGWRSVFDRDGVVIPPALDELMESEGVDRAILLSEYSPKVTGIQPVEDLLPIIKHNPERFSFLANINPPLHTPALRDFPGLTVVLAHGGRGWWYEAAASLALLHENVWIELSGLPPRKLPEYYARFDLARLARKFIFGTDWPGTPGIARNARALAALDLGGDTLVDVLAGNATRIYRGLAGRD